MHTRRTRKKKAKGETVQKKQMYTELHNKHKEEKSTFFIFSLNEKSVELVY